MENEVLAFRLQNFMGFEDTGWLDIKPITLLFGRNSTGKSALIRALLLLRQSIGFNSLIFDDKEGTDIGLYSDFVYNHDTSRYISFCFRVDMWDIDKNWGDNNMGVVSSWAELELKYALDHDTIRLKVLDIRAKAEIYEPELKRDVIKDKSLFLAERKPIDDFELLTTDANISNSDWYYSSELLDFDFYGEKSIWQFLDLVPTISIVPYLDADDFVGQKQALGEEFQLIADILQNFRTEIDLFLKSIVYIGPIRSEPQRFYDIRQLGGNAIVGKYGQNSLQTYLTAQKQGSSQFEYINQWLKKSQLGYQLKIIQWNEHAPLYSVFVVDKTNFDSNLRDVGFGMSQALPVVIQSLLAEPGSLVIIEQPELHLHPSAQAELADLFIMRANEGVRFLIETHSEHLLLRLQRRIAETTYGKMNPDSTQESDIDLDHESVNLVFVYRTDSRSKTEFIAIDHRGQLVEPSTDFQDFFEQDYNDTMNLSQVTAQIMRLENQ